MLSMNHQLEGDIMSETLMITLCVGRGEVRNPPLYAFPTTRHYIKQMYFLIISRKYDWVILESLKVIFAECKNLSSKPQRYGALDGCSKSMQLKWILFSVF